MTLDEELPRFASIVSHELAQPLQVASGYLEMLRAEFGSALDPTAARWLDHVNESIDRVRRLVQDMVAFARAGSSDTAPEAVDLNLVAEMAIRAVRTSPVERAADIAVGPLPVVIGDEAQLVAVFGELVDNAIRFVSEGVSPLVRISADHVTEGVIVTVDDNGPGIPAPEREMIFDLFRRRSGEEGPGTGLGLALCRRIIDGFGGRIWIEDSDLGGARVRFLIGVGNVAPQRTRDMTGTT